MTLPPLIILRVVLGEWFKNDLKHHYYQKEEHTGCIHYHHPRYVKGNTGKSKDTLWIGLHQGSTLSPLLFIIIMGVLASSIQRDPPWAMLFADDLVLCEESRLEVEQQLDSWREVLEGN